MDSLEQRPANQVEALAPLLALLTKALAQRGEKIAPGLKLLNPATLQSILRRCCEESVDEAAESHQVALLHVLTSLPAERLIQADAVRSLVPLLGIEGSREAVQTARAALLAGLLNFSTEVLQALLESGLLPRIQASANLGHADVVSALIGAMAEACNKEGSARPLLASSPWWSEAEKLLLRLLRPQAPVHVQLAAVKVASAMGQISLLPSLIYMCQHGPGTIRIEALVGALSFALPEDMAVPICQTCASALGTASQTLRARAWAALTEALHSKHMPAATFNTELSPLVIAQITDGPSAADRTAAISAAAEALVKFPERDLVTLLSAGALQAITSQLKTENLSAQGVVTRALMRAMPLAALQLAETLIAWLRCEECLTRKVAAAAIASYPTSLEAVQTSLDTGLLKVLFEMPREPEKEEPPKRGQPRPRLTQKQLQELAKAKAERDERDRRVARDAADAAVLVVKAGSKEQKQAAIDIGAADWLCTALDLEMKKLSLSMTEEKNLEHYRKYWVDSDDEEPDYLKEQGLEAKARGSEAEEGFLRIGDALDSVLRLGGEPEQAMIAAFQATKNLRGELRNMTQSKALPGCQKLAKSLLQRLTAKQQQMKLERVRCERCKVNPKTCYSCEGKGTLTCRSCKGSGLLQNQCRACKGSGTHSSGASCSKCNGSGTFQSKCKKCDGGGQWPCPKCEGSGSIFCRACDALRRKTHGQAKLGPEPEPGISVVKCSAADVTMLQNLWTERGGNGKLEAAWKVDNPLLAWRQRKFIQEFKTSFQRDPDELRGFHGTPDVNIFSIVENGFDAKRRAGQAFGAGEYFAKNPEVSKGYSGSGNYMLVCSLCLGTQASSGELGDGDHIWADGPQYYVIRNPEQVVPLFILRWRPYTDAGVHTDAREAKLEHVLQQPKYSTLKAKVREVPPNRPAEMSAEATDALWIGYLNPELEDTQLESDLRGFLGQRLPLELKTKWRLQIVRGRYTQAKVRLGGFVPRDLVLKLCSETFVEGGKERTITVDDAHGSPQQKCPRTIAMYCRGRNLRFVDPCWCKHEERLTEIASFELEALELSSAKGDEIVSKFMKSAPFHTGTPKVVEINAIDNPVLRNLHERYKSYLKEKNGGEPQILELYHGTNNKILDDVYTHGLSPPSDTKASENCKISGGKGLCTTLCDNNCTHCTERHSWDKCHMFGLGIYLADLAAKSHRYCSEPAPAASTGKRSRFRMIACSVAVGKTLEVEGHLKEGSAMHDVFSLRGLWTGDLEALVKPLDATGYGKNKTKPPAAVKGCEDGTPIEQHDLLFVKGLGSSSRPGVSVHNSEYISFHPYQCLPRYEIVYEI
eukprot:TRINITY_DN19409_c0_g3_i1.p1 TRINITY_DN19409_c0_g3~~TRINITY_DN19409_c0_g3_i1.p1  ORF type:complete len:1373 (-),score=316.79 TRINITY_DN19409_c0_g3_i1:99-4079(-)